RRARPSSGAIQRIGQYLGKTGRFASRVDEAAQAMWAIPAVLAPHTREQG
ncbi:MAG: hypothetical protein IPF71_18945, partial [Rhodoferax sp.]|nr:hypothetical protein [Rhodoferax sp.]